MANDKPTLWEVGWKCGWRTTRKSNGQFPIPCRLMLSATRSRWGQRLGQGEVYYKKVVKPVLHSFMGFVFEEMCRYYTLMKGITGEYGCFITSVGTWWGVENVTDKNGDMRSQSADIDIVALSEIDKKAVIGECKFKNEKIDKGIYETLIRRGKLINAKYKVSKYLFFSLSGYTDWFEELADEDVLLLTLDSLYE